MKKIILIISVLIIIPLFSFGRSLEEIKRSGVIYVAFTDAWWNSINRHKC